MVSTLKCTVSPRFTLMDVAKPWTLGSPLPEISHSDASLPAAVFSHATRFVTPGLSRHAGPANDWFGGQGRSGGGGGGGAGGGGGGGGGFVGAAPTQAEVSAIATTVTTTDHSRGRVRASERGRRRGASPLVRRRPAPGGVSGSINHTLLARAWLLSRRTRESNAPNVNSRPKSRPKRSRYTE